MDARDFDLLTRTFSAAGTRRALVRLLAALPLEPLLVASLVAEPAAANRRRRPTLRKGRDEQRDRVQSERKKKRKSKCVKAGQPTSKKRKCCKGLVKGAAGHCDAPASHCDVCASGCPYTSVQSAIAHASGPGAITICPGAYTENVTINRNFSLIGAGGGDGPGNTILQGTGGCRVLSVAAGVIASLQRLRITGGGSDIGAGIFNEGELTLTDCTITGNEANGNGGGIYNTGDSRLALTGCNVSANTAGGGGGIFNAGVCTIESSSFTFNEAGVVWRWPLQQWRRLLQCTNDTHQRHRHGQQC